VADGTRTRDHRDHNPELYQLSYRHRARMSVARAARRADSRRAEPASAGLARLSARGSPGLC
jgi:hypothetical protein